MTFTTVRSKKKVSAYKKKTPAEASLIVEIKRAKPGDQWSLRREN